MERRQFLQLASGATALAVIPFDPAVFDALPVTPQLATFTMGGKRACLDAILINADGPVAVWLSNGAQRQCLWQGRATMGDAKLTTLYFSPVVLEPHAVLSVDGADSVEFSASWIEG